MTEPVPDYITQEDHGDQPPAGYVARVDGAHTLAVEERLRIIADRMRKVQQVGIILAPAPDSTDAQRLHLLIQHDAPWLVAQVDRLLREAAAARKQTGDLRAQLGNLEKRNRNQRAALSAAQAREGRRQARGGRG